MTHEPDSTPLGLTIMLGFAVLGAVFYITVAVMVLT